MATSFLVKFHSFISILFLLLVIIFLPHIQTEGQEEDLTYDWNLFNKSCNQTIWDDIYKPVYDVFNGDAETYRKMAEQNANSFSTSTLSQRMKDRLDKQLKNNGSIRTYLCNGFGPMMCVNEICVCAKTKKWPLFNTVLQTFNITETNSTQEQLIPMCVGLEGSMCMNQDDKSPVKTYNVSDRYNWKCSNETKATCRNNVCGGVKELLKHYPDTNPGNKVMKSLEDLSSLFCLLVLIRVLFHFSGQVP